MKPADAAIMMSMLWPLIPLSLWSPRASRSKPRRAPRKNSSPSTTGLLPPARRRHGGVPSRASALAGVARGVGAPGLPGGGALWPAIRSRVGGGPPTSAFLADGSPVIVYKGAKFG
jgi:hypothetical protein